MKSLLYIGGPLILFTGLAFWTDFFTLPEEEPGIVHFSGVPMGGMFQLNTKYYECDESGGNCVLVDETNEFGEIADLELEQQAIEYRDGTAGEYNKTKQPGIAKYTNIHMKRFSDFNFDYSQWKFVPNRTYFNGDLALPDVKVDDQLLKTDRSPELPGPKFDEDAMEEMEVETEELQLDE